MCDTKANLAYEISVLIAQMTLCEEMSKGTVLQNDGWLLQLLGFRDRCLIHCSSVGFMEASSKFLFTLWTY